ncbi:MAG: MmgE/PrpD family protein [Candidatus Freyarchaeota archaeon]
MEGVTKVLADFAVETSFNKLPRRVIEHARLCVLDWIGVALAGSQETLTKTLTSIIEEIGGRKESTIIGANTKTSCLNAALVNGVMGHAVELDDIHEESVIHPAAPVIPAALAVAERENVTGKDLITSIVVSYEVEIRIGMSIMPSHYRFWHTTGTCGTFGATVAAGKILGLDREKMLYALGIAGTQAAGLIEVFGTMSKSLNVGKAAMNGVISALLAERGFTSSDAILEAEQGYCRATSEEFNPDKITKDLGKKFELVNNIFKRHASCGHTHGAIDAVLHISEKHRIRPENIREIIVETYPIAVDVVGKNFEPKTVFEAKFSLPYCLAIALMHGKVGLTELSEKNLRDPKILELSHKVKVASSPKYANARLGCAKVTIHTLDGKKYTRQVLVPKGYPKNPLTKAELEEKFIELSSLALPTEQAKELLRTINNLEKLNEVEALTILLMRGQKTGD